MKKLIITLLAITIIAIILFDVTISSQGLQIDFLNFGGYWLEF